MITKEQIDQVAITINGPHSSAHIGPDKLKELQQVRWDRQTSQTEKNICRAQARSVLEGLAEDAKRHRKALHDIAYKSVADDDLGWCQRIAKEALGVKP
ncbi:hypothetical protein [Sulfitobacter sp. R18_1]|uniref:hypothetical protein n=1 Tax=Sulfitobacter sp. R18_1 TaxID=2821104 RepID=UPI001ADD2DF7|nr:hypothetical protein [Sulfitobacter sp. R18_1]MBO9428270.1 hypothetical protein [Sulfitobacter sp. R18_1]